MKPSEGDIDVLEIGHWVGLGSMMDIDEPENLGFGPRGDSSWPGCAPGTQRSEAHRVERRTERAGGLIQRRGGRFFFRVLIMAMGSLLEAKMENIADIAMEKMGTFS